eukprot:m.462421 g.462421  ORF g.462421 m.462421 type:complete len:65 (-) comp22649_c0_seq1:346-540(-)
MCRFAEFDIESEVHEPTSPHQGTRVEPDHPNRRLTWRSSVTLFTGRYHDWRLIRHAHAIRMPTQ